MKKTIILILNLAGIFFLDSCSPVYPPSKVVVGELIEGRYYCLPGCNGHVDKYMVCTTMERQQELLKRAKQFSIAMAN